MSEEPRTWFEVGGRTTDPAVAAARFAVVASALGAHVADADVEVRVDGASVPAVVVNALESLRARRRRRWARRVRVQVAEPGRGVDAPSSDAQVRRARADVQRVAGYTHVMLVGADGALVGGVHEGLVTAALTAREVALVTSRLGEQPVEIVSPPTGLAALLSMKPRGGQQR
ncbi:hypothetical protein GCM10023221_24190 [Luteimicrobium xylanilyticum]|uniref:Uncharacterized protein n=1 Tax=Luteimicrobium xylanilyticum TaxID=1133546 RepID=A0A5P9QI96_9MICO|nr:hypothetical protein [Luteimicrobium xylanilyticum]QFV00196.1 hypothetical protein KDY119_03731 [Luteimicrobium xylanilyticum]